MANFTLKGGFYQGRSVIANAQRCLNLYPEKNAEDAPSPYTMYLTPGLTILRAQSAADGPAAGVSRGGFTASNGDAFCVVGRTIYFVDAAFRFNALGTLVDDLTTPVSMQDNGIDLVIVDGTDLGYTVNLTTYAFAQITDPNFFGADKVDYIDTFLVFNLPGTRTWYSSDSNSVSFNALALANKTGLPDLLQSIICMHREVWLLGTRWSTEVWYDAGTSPFPFQLSPGVFMEQGCVAKYSICKNDLMIFWLSRDKDGLATVFMGQPGGKVTRISTPAIAALLSVYDGDVLSSVIGMTYKQQDHVFYMINLPDRTLSFDVSESLWHERAYINDDGEEECVRYNWTTLMHNQVVCGDRETGALYKLDLGAYTDINPTTGEASPITRRRGFPAIVLDGDQASFPMFRAFMQTGEADQSLEDLDVQVWLRWSQNGGRTWGQPVAQSLGKVGEYMTQPQWRQLGVSRDMVFELFWSMPANTALLSAFITQPQVASTGGKP